jgi:hypothetical protein
VLPEAFATLYENGINGLRSGQVAFQDERLRDAVLRRLA